MVRFWDAPGRRQLGAALTASAGSIHNVAFSPGGRSLASADIPGTGVPWDLQTRHPLGAPLQTQHLVNSVAYSPDGRTLAAANGDHGTVSLWDVQAHHLIRTLRIGNSGRSTASCSLPTPGFSQPAARPGQSSCRSLPGDKPLATLNGATGPVYSVAFSSDGGRSRPRGSTGRSECGGESGSPPRRTEPTTCSRLGTPLRHNASGPAMHEHHPRAGTAALTNAPGCEVGGSSRDHAAASDRTGVQAEAETSRPRGATKTSCVNPLWRDARVARTG